MYSCVTTLNSNYSHLLGFSGKMEPTEQKSIPKRTSGWPTLDLAGMIYVVPVIPLQL